MRVHRLHPGQRGHQADRRHRRPAGRPADDLRRPGDAVPAGQGPQGPQLRGLRREPDRHRAHRLRGLLRRRLRGGAGGGDGLHDHSQAAQGVDRRRREHRDHRRPRAQRVRDRLHPGRQADPEERVPHGHRAGVAAPGQEDRLALQDGCPQCGSPRGPEVRGLLRRGPRRRRRHRLGQPDRTRQAGLLTDARFRAAWKPTAPDLGRVPWASAVFRPVPRGPARRPVLASPITLPPPLRRRTRLRTRGRSGSRAPGWPGRG
ncbi:hypothetical protein SGPA1_11952 [Streptomyces misionensis JCM 4497]